MKKKFDLYEHVTELMIDAMDSGTVPWAQPWSALPRNGESQRPYSGINVLLLWAQAQSQGLESQEWFTLKQLNAAGGTISPEHRKSWAMVTFATKLKRKDDPDKEVFFRRYYKVWNRDQIEGLPPAPQRESENAAADALLEASGASIRYGEMRAFYAPDSDTIGLPHRSAFRSEGDFWATALHELTHWTGHNDRCNRQLEKRFDQDAYAMEELVAEFGSAFLCAAAGVALDGLQHPEYLQHWRRRLSEDKYAVFTAARLAQQAAEYVLTAQHGLKAA